MKPWPLIEPEPQEAAWRAWMRRRMPWLLISFGVLLVMAAFWWPEPPVAAAPERAIDFPWARANVSDGALAGDAPPAPAATALAASAVAVRAGGLGAFDVCGLGRISLPGGVPDEVASGGVDALPAPVGSEPLAQARAQLVAGLNASATPRARVAAELLQRPPADDEPALQAWAGALLQQARSASDPVALAWAEEACGYLPGDGSQGQACRLQLIRERLRLEPDNAHHWAALADEDPGAADEAWQGLLQARRWHESPQALVLATQQALPPDVPGYLRLALGAEIGTRAGALPSPGEGFLQDRCRDDAPGRRAECDAVAQVLVDQGDGTQTLALGLKLGQVAGWPAERLKTVQRELEALASEPARWQPDATQPLSCRGVEAWQSHLAQVAAVGELQALRQRLPGAPLPR